MVSHDLDGKGHRKASSSTASDYGLPEIGTKMSTIYTTGQIARLAGLHPNTVRKYEEWELIQKPQRKENGYRIFTDIHRKQFELTKKAFHIEVLQSGLRKKNDCSRKVICKL